MLNSLFSNSERQKCFEILELYGLPTDSGWWSKYPKRAVEEITKLGDNTNSIFNAESNKLIFSELVSTNFGNYYSISIETGYDHPYVQPEVYIKIPYIEPSTKIHMYDDGRLCLMKPEVYHTQMFILDIRNKAASWCFCHDIYKETGKWDGAEARH